LNRSSDRINILNLEIAFREFILRILAASNPMLINLPISSVILGDRDMRIRFIKISNHHFVNYSPLDVLHQYISILRIVSIIYICLQTAFTLFSFMKIMVFNNEMRSVQCTVLINIVDGLIYFKNIKTNSSLARFRFGGRLEATCARYFVRTSDKHRVVY